MINMRIEGSEKRVYIDVSGYIDTNESKNFLNKYNQLIRQIKSSQYTLVVKLSSFECERNEDIRTVCMSFLKTGFRDRYIVDPDNYIMHNMSLGSIERKIFNKSVKVVSTISTIK